MNGLCCGRGEFESYREERVNGRSAPFLTVNNNCSVEGDDLGRKDPHWLGKSPSDRDIVWTKSKLAPLFDWELVDGGYDSQGSLESAERVSGRSFDQYVGDFHPKLTSTPSNRTDMRNMKELDKLLDELGALQNERLTTLSPRMPAAVPTASAGKDIGQNFRPLRKETLPLLNAADLKSLNDLLAELQDWQNANLDTHDRPTRYFPDCTFVKTVELPVKSDGVLDSDELRDIVKNSGAGFVKVRVPSNLNLLDCLDFVKETLNANKPAADRTVAIVEYVV